MFSDPQHIVLSRRIERAIGAAPVSFRPVTGGCTPAARLIATFADGRSLFVKAATNPLTAGWLRDEHRVYLSLRGSFMPRFHGWDDDGSLPILLLEDLSGAHWPPPWSGEHLDALRDALRRVAASGIPGIPALGPDSTLLKGWGRVADDPEPFLSLGLVSRRWLDLALPVLLEEIAKVDLSGDALLHCDVRSDNVCFVDGRAVLIDWNWACTGNARIDIGGWLPSLHAEGGPLPESMLPDGGDMAVMMSGFFACNAGLPGIPDAPLVRPLQRRQLASALPWAARALGLPPLDGSAAG